MTTALYETDFSQWAVAQADILRDGDLADLDLDNLIEEIEDMAGRHRDELHSRFRQIMEHLLKMQCEPESLAVNGWRREIQAYRLDLRHMLKRNASLRATAGDYVAEAYEDARLLAAAGSACAVEDFPEFCPWTADQLLDPDFWPE